MLLFLKERAYFRSGPFRFEDKSELDALYFVPNILLENVSSCITKEFFLNSIRETYNYLSESVKKIFSDKESDVVKRKKTSVALYKHVNESLKIMKEYVFNKEKKEQFKKDNGSKGIKILNEYFNSIVSNFYTPVLMFFYHRLI